MAIRAVFFVQRRKTPMDEGRGLAIAHQAHRVMLKGRKTLLYLAHKAIAKVDETILVGWGKVP